MRTCKRCGVRKGVTEFYGSSWTPPRIRWTCKECDAERMKRYHARNRDEINKKARHAYRPRKRKPRVRVDTTNARSRQWRLANPVEAERILEHYRDKSLRILAKRRNNKRF